MQCDRCKRYFHMRCVQPPLIAKPSRGYGWTCAPCSRRHEQEVDSHEVRHTPPQSAPKLLKSNAPAPRGRGRPRKDKLQAEREENFPVKHFKMWPFRYFGYAFLITGHFTTWLWKRQHTVAEDTLGTYNELLHTSNLTTGGRSRWSNISTNCHPPGPEVSGKCGTGTGAGH